MNLNQYAIKLALSAALAYAFGNAMHSERNQLRHVWCRLMSASHRWRQHWLHLG